MWRLTLIISHQNGWTDEEITAAMDSGSAFGSVQAAEDYRSQMNKTINKGVPVDYGDAQALDTLTPIGGTGSLTF